MTPTKRELYRKKHLCNASFTAPSRFHRHTDVKITHVSFYLISSHLNWNSYHRRSFGVLYCAVNISTLKYFGWFYFRTLFRPKLESSKMLCKLCIKSFYACWDTFFSAVWNKPSLERTKCNDYLSHIKMQVA